MKLVVQIPAFNEEKNISRVIKEIPKKIDGIDKIEILVIDDGSSDNTSLEAKKAGAHYVVRNKENIGLAQTFQRGINKSLSLGAGIIVNTDADFQYNQNEISKLIQPIIQGKADIVSGNRQVETLSHMVSSKKYGNIIGSKVVELSAGYKIADASSGFRAYSRDAALRLFVISKHTYTHETLIQAKRKNLKVVEVPVEFRKREQSNSKLISSVGSHIKKSMSTIMRSTLMYNSMKTLGYLGVLMMALGAIPMIRWAWLTYIEHSAGNHIQSLLLGLLLIMLGFLTVMLGFISDLIATNRRHLEEILYRIRRAELKISENGK
ncbi:glycosyl transferase [Candidatus Pacearchaeota archaeon CG10_big_fil_rev_8_21_14_0_10_32_14]|nr:MAG: glycosyl transferase [Candidatus Pacearchaeota archaeon CG10_big_fil_rev_8_21_14_0_10_32_14]